MHYVVVISNIFYLKKTKFEYASDTSNTNLYH